MVRTQGNTTRNTQPGAGLWASLSTHKLFGLWTTVTRRSCSRGSWPAQPCWMKWGTKNRPRPRGRHPPPSPSGPASAWLLSWGARLHGKGGGLAVVRGRGARRHRLPQPGSQAEVESRPKQVSLWDPLSTSFLLSNQVSRPQVRRHPTDTHAFLSGAPRNGMRLLCKYLWRGGWQLFHRSL